MNKFIKVLLISVFSVCIAFSGAGYAYASDSITIVIDPGHGGPKQNDADLGANYNGLKEKEINLTTALALYNELSQYKNVKVYMTRIDDTEISLKDRVNIAKSVNADAMVCVHYNASGDHLFYGGEAFIPSKGDLYATGLGLATSITNRWKTVGTVNKGIKTRIGKNGDYYGVIRFGAEAKIPVIILEHCYLDNYHDAGFVNETDDFNRFGKLDAAGIADYFGLSKTEKKTAVYPQMIVKTQKGVVRDDTTGPVDVSMRIDSYNSATGEVKYTIFGRDPESKVMFHGASPYVKLDSSGKVVPILTDLSVFGDGDRASGTVFVPKGYSGPLYGILYNNYNASSDTVVALLSK